MPPESVCARAYGVLFKCVQKCIFTEDKFQQIQGIPPTRISPKQLNEFAPNDCWQCSLSNTDTSKADADSLCIHAYTHTHTHTSSQNLFFSLSHAYKFGVGKNISSSPTEFCTLFVLSFLEGSRYKIL